MKSVGTFSSGEEGSGKQPRCSLMYQTFIQHLLSARLRGKRATKRMIITRWIHYSLPLSQERCQSSRITAGGIHTCKFWNPQTNKSLKVQRKVHVALDLGKPPQYGAPSRYTINGWGIKEWLGHGCSSWKVWLFKEKLLEIGPDLENITKSGHVFTLEPLYQGSGNVLIFLLLCNKLVQI